MELYGAGSGTLWKLPFRRHLLRVKSETRVQHSGTSASVKACPTPADRGSAFARHQSASDNPSHKRTFVNGNMLGTGAAALRNERSNL
jgi:hypothetical protein